MSVKQDVSPDEDAVAEPENDAMLMEGLSSSKYDVDASLVDEGPYFARLHQIDVLRATAASRGAEFITLGSSSLGIAGEVTINRDSLKSGIERATERLFASMASDQLAEGAVDAEQPDGPDRETYAAALAAFRATAVRAWAREHGLEVPERGSIPEEVVVKYRDAT